MKLHGFIRIVLTLLLLYFMWTGSKIALYIVVTLVTIVVEMISWIIKEK